MKNVKHGLRAEEDHVRLRDTLAGIEGNFMVSYNDCQYIRELYQDFRIEPVTRLNNLAQRYDGGCEFPEVLVANYDMNERRDSLPVQMSLFELYAAEELAKEEEITFQIPQELLKDAGIPMDADLDIVCQEQKIIILPAETAADVEWRGGSMGFVMGLLVGYVIFTVAIFMIGGVMVCFFDEKE